MLNENCPGGVKAPLELSRKISEEFKSISGNKDVSVYWNSLEKQYHLMMKRKFIMYLKRPISSNDRRRVKEHFNKLRSGWYRKNVSKNVRDKETAREQRSTDMREDFRLDMEELLNDTVRSKRKLFTI